MFNLLFKTFDGRCSTLLEEGLAIFEAACRREGLSVPAATRFSFLVDPTKKRVRTELVLRRQRKDTCIQPASQPRVFRSETGNTPPHETYLCSSGITVEHST